LRGVDEAIAPMKFVYQGLQRDGRLVTGSIEAASERSAHRDLSRRGVTPTAIRSEATARPVQRLRWRRKSSRRDYALMLKQLHTLLAGGVPLADAVTSLTPNDASGLGVALVELNTGLRRGEPFARAFARCFPGIPGYVQRMLESGELSGRLAEAVADAAAAMEHTARVQAELRNALIYPAFLVGFGLLAIAFIFAIVVPRFAIMFRGRFDKLPWLSYTVIVTGMWVRSHWLLSTALIAGIGWAGVYLLWRPQSREAAFGVAMRLPVVHSWLIEIEIARWAAVLARLLEQRVSLIQSLELARLDLRSRDMRSRFAQVERDVRAGAGLSAAVDTSALLPPMAMAMLRVGERSGNLAGMIRHLASMYDERVRDRIKVALAIIEPIAIVLIGGFIGLIAIAIFLGITSINNIPGL
jgi:general secretion pathway protein F